jgi:endoglucanase
MAPLVLSVQILDFTGLTGEGSGYRSEAAGQVSQPFSVGHRLYEPLAADALRFFYVMRAGTAISDEVAPGYGRPAGHVGRPPNRGDRDGAAWTGAEADLLYPGWRCAGTFDVSGRWYDAGDFGKYVPDVGSGRTGHGVDRPTYTPTPRRSRTTKSTGSAPSHTSVASIGRPSR